MSTVNKAYKFKLLPNEDQKRKLDQHFGCVRFVYNYLLSVQKDRLQSGKPVLKRSEMQKELVLLKKKSEYSWLKEVNSQSLICSIRNLDLSFCRYFNRCSNFPKFHSKKKKNSFAVPQYIRLRNTGICIPKIKGYIKFVKSRIIDGIVKEVVISKLPTEEYYVSIRVESNVKSLEKNNLAVGIDLGVSNFLITSDGEKYSSNKFFNQYSKSLKSARKHLSRKCKGSNSWYRQKLKISRIRKKIYNSRKDKLHKISTELIKKYRIICCEDLGIIHLLKNEKVRVSITDASWGMFLSMLRYKALWYNRELIFIDRYFPSSKKCSECGYIKDKLNLNQRIFKCPKCGAVIDRDMNAAKNILDEGLRVYRMGRSITQVEDSSFRCVSNEA